MVQTRSQAKHPASGLGGQAELQFEQKGSHSTASESSSAKQSGVKNPKARHDQEVNVKSQDTQTPNGGTAQSLHSIKKDHGLDRRIIAELLERYGDVPLHDTDLETPSEATPETILALVLNAMLSSTRISHTIAAQTVDAVIKAGYHKLEVLKKSTWQERTNVLTQGGYAHYRERTATMMGELAEMIEKDFGGDLNSILKQASTDPVKVRALIKTIKGIGDVGVDIFCDTAQHVWPCLAPFIDPRSLAVAESIGIGGDVQKIREAIDKKPEDMARLANALTKVRLEKREKEFRK